MNWAEFFATLICNLIIGAFVYGRLTERVSSHTKQLQESQQDRSQLWQTAAKHGERISRIEGRLNGA